VTDLSTVLLAIGPAAVTGLVAFHAARIQTTVAERGIRARPGELEHQVRDKRRDERAAAYARYLETGLELHYISTVGHSRRLGTTRSESTGMALRAHS
jgi:hypothetical protein